MRFDALADPVFVLDVGKGWRQELVACANLAACELLGVSRAGVLELPGAALFPPEGIAALNENFALVRQRGRVLFESELLVKSGTSIPVEIHAALAPGSAAQAVLACRDITLRNLVTDSLEAVRRNYRKIFEMAAKGIFQTTMEGRFIKANPAMARMLGYSSARRLMVDVADIGSQLYVDSRDRLRFLGALRKKGEVRRYETRFRRRGNGEIWVSLTARMEKGETDFESYIEGFCEDITELKQAEQALKDSEELHRETLSCIDDTVLITRDDGSLTYVSPNSNILFGLAPEAVMAKGDIGSLLGYGFFNPVELEAAGALNNMDVAVQGADGNLRSLLVSVKRVDIRGGTRLFVCRDVSRHRLLQAEALRAAHLASLGELAAGVAHEINNPINGIMLYGELLLEQAGVLGENADVPERIITQAERVAAIVRNLLVFSRKPEAQPGPVNALAILEDSLALTRTRLLRDHVRLEVAASERLPRIRGRDQEIQQVFLNLISNAGDALNSRYPGRDPDKVLRISLSARQGSAGALVRAEFLDHGTGIPESILGRIFDPFFSTKPKDQGTGLGLSTTNKIVQGMGGGLHFESVVGEYTLATLDFPVWEPVEPDAAPGQDAGQEPT